MMTTEIGLEELTLYAMRLLPLEEMAAVERALGRSVRMQQELTTVMEALGVAAMSVEPVAPEAGAKARFVEKMVRERRVAATAPVAPMVREAREPVAAPVPQARRRRGGMLPWLGWALAVGALFAVAPVMQERARLQAKVAEESAQLQAAMAQQESLTKDAARTQQIVQTLTDAKAQQVSLHADGVEATQPTGQVSYLEDSGSLLFTGSRFPQLPEEKHYALWVIPADGSAAVAAGGFRPDDKGVARVMLPELAKGIQAAGFGVTVERNGGAGPPSLPALLIGGE